MNPSSQVFLGIDFSGDHLQWSPGRTRSCVWIAELIHDSSPLGRIQDLRRVRELEGSAARPFQRLVERLRRRDFAAAGIDAPFSLPASTLSGLDRREVLCAVDALECGKRPFPEAGKLIATFLPEAVPNGTKLYRQTEKNWKDRSVEARSTTFWKHRGGAPFTAAAMKLLAAVEGPVWPWTRSKDGLLVEAFPAAQLRALDLPHNRYSKDNAAALAVRNTILEGLEERGLDFGSFRDRALSSPDALDAVIASLAGVAVVRGELDQQPTEAALKEGWIAVWESRARG